MKYIYIAAGLIFCGIGSVGILLPVLPTVPFLLLASFCFSRSSKHFNTWFTGTRLYKNHLESFQKERSMKLAAKIRIMIFATGMLVITFILLNHIYIKAFIIIIAVTMYYYFIFKIKTIKR